jgi:hypothetical protein
VRFFFICISILEKVFFKVDVMAGRSQGKQIKCEKKTSFLGSTAKEGRRAKEED